MAGALTVVTMRNPVYGAAGLLASFLAIAALFLLRHAEFLAVVQTFVYGGGIMVLFLFVIMLVNLHRLHETRMLGNYWKTALVVSLLLIGIFGFLFLQVEFGAAHRGAREVRRCRGRGARQLRGRCLGALPRVPPAVRDRFRLPAGGHGGRRSPGKKGLTVEITTNHYLILSALLFAIGVAGILTRRNMITVLMSVELVLNSVNLNLIAFSYQLSDLTGQIFAIFTIAVAAGEAAVGLGILIALFRLYDDTHLDKATELQG